MTKIYLINGVIILEILMDFTEKIRKVSKEMKKYRKFLLVLIVTLIISIFSINMKIYASESDFGDLYTDSAVYNRVSEYTINDSGRFNQNFDRIVSSNYTYSIMDMKEHFLYVSIILEIDVREVDDGYLTNDFYILKEENGKIIDIEHSGVNVESLNLMPILRDGTIADDKVVIQNNELYLCGMETHIIYCKLNGVLVPIELKYCTYQNNDITYGDIICTNLNNGEVIDYEDICK